MTSTTEIASDDDLIALLSRTMQSVAEAAPDLMADAEHHDHRWMAVAAAVATVGLAAGGWIALRGGDTRTLPVLDPNDPRPTLDSFRMSYGQSIQLNNASERMYRDCMATKGQVYAFPGISAAQIKSADLDPMWGLLGRTDPERAASIGYEPSPVNDFTDPNAGHVNDPAWETAYAGGPDGNGPTVEIIDPVSGLPTPGDTQLSGGCFGAVQAALFGDQARFTGLNMYVANQMDGGHIDMNALDDPRLRPFEAAWSDCLVEAGHDRYNGPLDVMRQFFAGSPDVPGRVPSKDEVATAVDDVACKQSTGLLKMAQDLHDAYSREAAARAPDIAAAHRDMLDQALVNATAFEDGTLIGTWRATASAEALHNSTSCTWLPGEVGGIDMSVGERVELTTYLDALSSALVDLPEAQQSASSSAASGVAVPPWLIGQSICLADPTLGQIADVRSVLQP